MWRIYGARIGQTQCTRGRGVYLYSPKREDAFEVRVGIHDISRENEEVGQSIFIGVRVRDRGRQIEACRG